jgi:dTDP-4-amino-4,6-dideoxygalactose transaminase
MAAGEAPRQVRPTRTASIPFNRPFVTGREYEYIGQAIANGHSAGNGPFTRECQALLEHITGSVRALLTTSCTDALEMCALLLRLQPGDEVIVPSFTFVSGANAFVLHGAKPVFIDIRPDTLNLDESRLEGLITPRTRAIVPVHYAGVACEMDPILEIARRHDIVVIEDAAHGLFGHYRDRPLGSLGSLATLSFHETKNVICGEGGALLINDAAYFERAEILRDKGTNRSRFFRGQVDKYTWVDVGSSFLPSDLLAAFLRAQLEARAEVQARRRRVWHYYSDHLRDWAEPRGIRLPVVPPHCDQPYHMFYLLLPSLEARQGLIEHLKARDILSVFHYQPLHLSEMGRRLGGTTGQCPVTEDVSDRLLRLPFYNDLGIADQEAVVAAIREFDPPPSARA